jgi:hypothetical protein
MFKCDKCKGDCKPSGTNVIGVEIQEYNDKEGWVSTEVVYDNDCHAKEALKLIKKDKVIRRIYSVFEHRQFSKFEETV